MEYITEEGLEQTVRLLRKKTEAKQLKFQAHSETLNGDKTLTVVDEKLQFLDPNGSDRIITLPAEESSKNIIFIFSNTANGAENLVVKDDSGATIVTISQDEGGVVFCDGVVWKGLVGGELVSSAAGAIPIGTIISYLGGYFTDGVNGGFTMMMAAANTIAAVNALLNPSGFYVCNGAALNLPASPIFNGAGRYLPKLTDDRFIMGDTLGGTPGGDNAMAHTHVVGTLAIANESSHTHADNLSIDNESAHTHGNTLSINNESSHTHADNLSIDNESAHTHGNTLSINNESSHTHGYGTLGTDTEANHGHGDNFSVNAEAAHTHGVTVNNHTLTIAQIPSHRHQFYVKRIASWADNNRDVPSVSAGTWFNTSHVGGGAAHNHGASSGAGSSHGHGLSGGVSAGGSHSHSVTSGATGSGSIHTHSISGSVGAGTAHSHSVSGSVGAGTAHNHSISGSVGTGTAHNHSISGSVGAGTAHNHSISGSTGAASVTENRPKFLGCFYIMRAI